MGLVINSSSYAGELALPYIAPAILAADSIANGYITLKENVKYQAVLKALSGGSIQAATCDFTDGETDLELDEVILAVTNLMVNEQICKADFRSDWEALQTGRGFINDQLPPNFETFLLQYLAARVAESIERNMWHGNYNETNGGTSGGNAVTAFTGILAHIVAGTPGAETTVAGTFTPDAQATGILTHLNTLVNNAPFTIQNNSNSVIMMSKRSLFLLQRAMAGLLTTSGGYSPTFVGENRPTTFLGFPIVTPAGFPNDTLVMSYVGNLFFGTDLTSDYNQAVVVDMTQTDASDNVRIAMRFTGGTQVGHLSDISVVRRSS
jgi:hypothetical protein